MQTGFGSYCIKNVKSESLLYLNLNHIVLVDLGRKEAEEEDDIAYLNTPCQCLWCLVKQ